MNDHERQARQTRFSKVVSERQRALEAAKITCIGAGGLGSPALLYLAAAGIGTISVVDSGQVDRASLSRQILFSPADQGRSRAEAAAERLIEYNPSVHVKSRATRLTSANALAILSGQDVIIDGADDAETTLLLGEASTRLGIPLVHGSLSEWEGRVAVFNPASRQEGQTACFRCWYTHRLERPLQPATQLGAVAGVVGAYQALLAIRLSLPATRSQVRTAEMHVWNALTLDWVRRRIAKDPRCPVCSMPLEGRSLRFQAQERKIDGETLRQLLEAKEVSVLDVRSEAEWRSGHLPGAICWPLVRLEQGEFPPLPRDHALVIYCQSGIRSRRASEILTQAGYAALSELRQGLSAWDGRLPLSLSDALSE